MTEVTAPRHNQERLLGDADNKSIRRARIHRLLQCDVCLLNWEANECYISSAHQDARWRSALFYLVALLKRGTPVVLLDAPIGARRAFHRSFPSDPPPRLLCWERCKRPLFPLCVTAQACLDWHAWLSDSPQADPITVAQFCRVRPTPTTQAVWLFTSVGADPPPPPIPVDGVPNLPAGPVGVDLFVRLLRHQTTVPVLGLVLAGDTRSRVWGRCAWGVPPWVGWVESFPEERLLDVDRPEDACFGGPGDSRLRCLRCAPPNPPTSTCRWHRSHPQPSAWFQAHCAYLPDADRLQGPNGEELRILSRRPRELNCFLRLFREQRGLDSHPLGFLSDGSALCLGDRLRCILPLRNRRLGLAHDVVVVAPEPTRPGTVGLRSIDGGRRWSLPLRSVAAHFEHHHAQLLGRHLDDHDPDPRRARVLLWYGPPQLEASEAYDPSYVAENLGAQTHVVVPWTTSGMMHPDDASGIPTANPVWRAILRELCQQGPV